MSEDTLDLARRLLALHQAALNAEENGRSSDVAAMDALVAWNRFEDALTAAPALAQAYLEASAEIERLRAKLELLTSADWCDTPDADLGRQFKAFATEVEAASEKQWRGGDAERRMGLMSLGINQAIVMAAESNAETFTYTATGMQTGGKPLGDWTVTVARTALKDS